MNVSEMLMIHGGSRVSTSYKSRQMSQPDRTGMLVVISLLKLYSNEVIGLGPRPLRRGDALRQGNEAEYRL
jgi:hypothetical protein